MLEKSSKMIAREAMADLVGWSPGHGELPRYFDEVARHAKISWRMARSLWNDEVKNPEEHWALKQVRREAVVAKAQREAQSLASRFEAIARGLNAKDQDFYSPDATALIHAARFLRGLDSPGNNGEDR